MPGTFEVVGFHDYAMIMPISAILAMVKLNIGTGQSVRLHQVSILMAIRYLTGVDYSHALAACLT